MSEFVYLRVSKALIEPYPVVCLDGAEERAGVFFDREGADVTKPVQELVESAAVAVNGLKHASPYGTRQEIRDLEDALAKLREGGA